MAEILAIDGVGAVIQRLRQEAKLSLADLAQRLGWDKSRISKYENNNLRLSLPVLEEIAKGLGLRPEVLVLDCLRERYPSFDKSQAGRLVASLVKELGRS